MNPTTKWSTVVERGEDAPEWLLDYDRDNIKATFRTRCRITQNDDGSFTVNPLEPIVDCMIYIERISIGKDHYIVKGMGGGVIWQHTR